MSWDHIIGWAAAWGVLALLAGPALAETCIASVYGTKDHDQNGTETASGIPLNDALPTMAHKSRPLRSFARVANLANGRHAYFQVTDRGPYVAGRCIDLSHAAAILLGCDGLCPVAVQ